MNELVVIGDTCRRCGTDVAESSNFCSHCGLPTDAEGYPNVPAEVMDGGTESAIVETSGTGTTGSLSFGTPILDNRVAVIAILLCAGPMGLPALWFSRRFSQRTKIITTTVYLLLTAILPLAVAWYFLEIAVRPVVDVLGG